MTCDVPFLLGKPALKAMGARIDLEKNTIDFRWLGLSALPCHETAGGHPAVSIIAEGIALEVDLDSLAGDTECRAHGGVRIVKSAAVAAYMAEAGRDAWEKPMHRKPSVEEPGRKHALFYEEAEPRDPKGTL